MSTIQSVRKESIFHRAIYYYGVQYQGQTLGDIGGRHTGAAARGEKGFSPGKTVIKVFIGLI